MVTPEAIDPFTGARDPLLSGRSQCGPRGLGLPLRRLLLTSLATLMLGGCGAASLGGNPRDVGRGTRRDIALSVPETLISFGYAISNYRETGSNLYYETAWERREPFEDEAQRGAEECRTRIIVEARRSGGQIYTVTMRVENTALGFSLDEEWAPMPPTDMFRDHVQEITSEIQMKIDAGVRIR